MQFDLGVVDLADPLYQELIAAARECNISPKVFASQAVEVVLASRRLPGVQAAPHGARIGTGDMEEGND